MKTRTPKREKCLLGSRFFSRGDRWNRSAIGSGLGTSTGHATATSEESREHLFRKNQNKERTYEGGSTRASETFVDCGGGATALEGGGGSLEHTAKGQLPSRGQYEVLSKKHRKKECDLVSTVKGSAT